MGSARIRPAVVLCSLGAAISLAAGAAGAQGGGEAFTDTERQRLRAGELVVRDVTRREGPYRMLGGTSWQRVHAPVDQVWAAVNDTDAYGVLIPALERAELVRDDDDERLLRMHHRYSFASASYYARVAIDAERYRMRFDLDRSRPSDLRAGRGFIQLSPYRGDTIVSWGVLADPGGGMVVDVLGPLLHDWMLAVPRCVRDYVETGHGGC
ncbi:MAG TPA: SRPBCC family protein [Sandaracinaceae bacterium LLY-WYZ-13_1]|nr:SRPBCC family protein [Sandaracinaceae bacterium LLY-WYZ-13_1]